MASGKSSSCKITVSAVLFLLRTGVAGPGTCDDDREVMVWAKFDCGGVLGLADVS